MTIAPTTERTSIMPIDPPQEDPLVVVSNVKKKFCRSLKKSLWYGMQDIAHELNPFSRRTDRADHSFVAEDSDLRADEFWAVNDVSFELRRGECLGLIGHNGAGKTTLLKMLNGLIKPDSGRIEMTGRVGALIALGAGFNPILSGRENIHVNASVLGLKKDEIEDKMEEIIDFAEIGEFIDAPVQSYSSGMQVRLGFAIATTVKPDILILDEVLAVGDAAFRAKCELAISELMDDAAVILVSHNALHIRRLCNRVLWLRRGQTEGLGPTDDYLDRYGTSLSEEKKIEQTLVYSDSVRRVDLIDSQVPNQFNQPLKLQIKIDAAEEIAINNIVIGIHEVGVRQVAQSAMKVDYRVVGERILNFETEGIRLKDGNYSVTIAMYGEQFSELHARWVGVLGFKLESGIYGGTPYHFESVVH
ncbi:ABC transporter ATP-binding protein [Stieleria tagensis]|uniref:ABC transporter ATP-binding protein n=1 Tax=Stieleria tagensis TaxID=2956795 RepID=UPI00209B4CBB|nr:ABC transporter ATP-binding protein [Stieleria tagensis]